MGNHHSDNYWNHYTEFEGPQPGSEGFVPTADWLSKVLKLPVTDVQAKEKGGGGSEGASGARFFQCHVTYAGPLSDPNFGMPTELFVKLRTPKQEINEFVPEMIVSNLAKHMKNPPPMARVFHGGPNSVISENLQGDLAAGGGAEKLTIEEAEGALGTYAHLHSSFWGLPEIGGLRTLETWTGIFTGAFLGPKLQDTIIGYFGEAAPLIRKMRDEMDILKIVQSVAKRGTTLCQGDAHKGQLLHLKEETAAAEARGTWQLIDFGNAVIAPPAIDIGALTLDLELGSFDDWQALCQGYYDKLAGELGGRGVEIGLDFERFFMDVRFFTTLRLVFVGCFLESGAPGCLKEYVVEINKKLQLFDQDVYDAMVAGM